MSDTHAGVASTGTAIDSARNRRGATTSRMLETHITKTSIMKKAHNHWRHFYLGRVDVESRNIFLHFTRRDAACVRSHVSIEFRGRSVQVEYGSVIRKRVPLNVKRARARVGQCVVAGTGTQGSGQLGAFG